MIKVPTTPEVSFVPEQPGVYLMRDASDTVIYVGKAVNLRRRLQSYFTAQPRGGAKVLAMISHITHFDFVVCRNELEALILEANFIKRLRPFYNILLKDDRDYPYIRVTLHELYPRAERAWRVEDDLERGARYFGPYLAGDIYRALESIRSIFPVRTCRRNLPRDIGKERPCLRYDMGLCEAPCQGYVTQQDYYAMTEELAAVLGGRRGGLRQRLREEIATAAERLDFEAAAAARDRLAALERLEERQTAVLDSERDMDALGLAVGLHTFCVQKLEVRAGRINAAATFFMDLGALEPDHPAAREFSGAEAGDDYRMTQTEVEQNCLRAFIAWHYPEAAVIPPEIAVPIKFDEELHAGLTELLNSLPVRRKVQLLRPQRGERRHVLDMAQRTAHEALQRHIGRGRRSGEYTVSPTTRAELGRLAGCPSVPGRIEAYDISNIGDDDIACGMAVFIGDSEERDLSRLFNLSDLSGQDDYTALRCALERRLARLDDPDFGARPDLILVDGGIGHVNAAREALAAAGENIPLGGMVKDSRHRTRGLVIMPESEPIELSEANPKIIELSGTENQELLRWLTQIQNAAHRVAGRYSGKLRRARNLRYRLEDIPGVGPKRRQILLENFPSLAALAAASEEEISAIPGLSKTVATEIYTYFHPEIRENNTEEKEEG
ncbi:MAG: excinuclease ABC subunit UvrC [Clostridiaceae bacterium]|nr:excinuclease ABC subunit UvrC [Clostridiaceae bacterium]